MNERIRELAVQAEKLADEATNAYNDDTGNWRKVWNEVYDEKFAELIVRECMLICGAVQGAGEFRNMHEFASGAAQCKEIIKRDFGVGE